MSQVVFIRHGQSAWNLENRFSGWADVDLTEQGIREAHEGGKALKDAGFLFDVAHVSVLKRAVRTLWHVQEGMDQMWLPVVSDWRLNERHYGGLTGLNKSETAAQYGEDQVLVWRRSYDVPPPEQSVEEQQALAADPRYAGLSLDQVPRTECLKDCVERVLSYWNEVLAPAIRSGQRVLVVAHGNSMRALIKYLDNISDNDIVSLNIPNGVPLVYEFDEDLKPTKHYYLADPDEVAAKMAAVANQGKAK